jgi:hypothetical protein
MFLINASTNLIGQHAAAIVRNKMVVFGGDSGHHLLDDTKVVRSLYMLFQLEVY